MSTRAEDVKFRNELATTLENEDLADQILERLPMVPVDNLATKDDLVDLRVELLGKFAELRGEFGELRGEFGELRGEFGELRGEFGELRGEFGEIRGSFVALEATLDGKFDALRTEIAEKMRVQTWVMAGLVVSGMATMSGIAALS